MGSREWWRQGELLGYLIVRGTNRIFCGGIIDTRMVRCLLGARIKDISKQVQNILKGMVTSRGCCTYYYQWHGVEQEMKSCRVNIGRRRAVPTRVVTSGILPVPRVGVGIKGEGWWLYGRGVGAVGKGSGFWGIRISSKPEVTCTRGLGWSCPGGGDQYPGRKICENYSAGFKLEWRGSGKAVVKQRRSRGVLKSEGNR